MTGAKYWFDNLVLAAGLTPSDTTATDRAHRGRRRCDQFEFGDGELDGVE